MTKVESILSHRICCLQNQVDSIVQGNGIQSIVAGDNISVDDTDPLNPIVSSTGGGGASLRFGFAGEDDTAGEERIFSLADNLFAITTGQMDFVISGNIITIGDDDTGDSIITVDKNSGVTIIRGINGVEVSDVPNTDITNPHINGFYLTQDGLALVKETTDIFSPNTIRNGLVSGAEVTWLGDLDYEISTALYYIDGILHSSPITQVTLSASDPTDPRIDVFVLNDDNTASVVEGIPSSTPEKPDINPETQIEISFAIVESGTTTPDINQLLIFDEDTGASAEWNPIAIGANWVANDAAQHFSGSVSLAGTNLVTGNQARFQSSIPVNYTLYQLLNFHIFPSSWLTAQKLSLQFSIAGINVGNAVTIGNALYGINTSSATWQNVSIPLADFGNITGANSLKIRRIGGGTLAKVYIDKIQLLESPALQPQGLITVAHDNTLTGDGTTTHPLSVTVGIDTVLAQGQSLSTNRNIETNANGLIIGYGIQYPTLGGNVLFGQEVIFLGDHMGDYNSTVLRVQDTIGLEQVEIRANNGLVLNDEQIDNITIIDYDGTNYPATLREHHIVYSGANSTPSTVTIPSTARVGKKYRISDADYKFAPVTTDVTIDFGTDTLVDSGASTFLLNSIGMTIEFQKITATTWKIINLYNGNPL